VKLDERWVSSSLGQSLYIRPAAIANNSSLGVRTPDSGKIFVVCSPVGSYYPKGFKPVSIMCEQEEIRCAPGGSGSFKIGGNYGQTIRISNKAEK
jgi:branched-chain amino acid aminotransferase